MNKEGDRSKRGERNWEHLILGAAIAISTSIVLGARGRAHAAGWPGVTPVPYEGRG